MLKILTERQRLKVQLFFEGILVGLCTGAVIAAFRFLIDQADIYRPLWFLQFRSEIQGLQMMGGAVGAPIHLTKAISLFSVTLLILLFVAYLLSSFIKIDGQIAGSGVPQIKGVLQNKAQLSRPFRLLLMKFIASTTAISSGMSLGRAGISVQFGACIGKIINQLTSHRSVRTSNPETIEGKYLLTAGAGAGLAAVFNAPLAGVIFCVEELQKKLSPELLIVSMTSAISASAVVELIFGIRPVFETITPTFKNAPLISIYPTLAMLENITPIKFIISLIVLGVFVGILGAVFTKMLIFSLDFYDRIGVKGVKRFLIPLLLIIPIGFILPEILGCGNVLVDALLTKNFNLNLLIILFVGKFIFTMVCFGTNAPGGIFLPLLVLGALSGDIFSSVGIYYGFFSGDWTAIFIILAMAAYFAAVVKSPITGSVLILELTGNFSHLLALIIVSIIAFLASDLCGGKPAYSALLMRSESLNEK